MDAVRKHINEAKAYLAFTDPEWDAGLRAQVHSNLAIAEALQELLTPPPGLPESLPEPVRLLRLYNDLTAEDETPPDVAASEGETTPTP